MGRKKVGILQFLGTNCDRDIWKAVEALGYSPCWLWYEDTYDLTGWEAIFIPGGFSYGDYLRGGALAAHSPVMNSVREFAKKGFPVFGICNGFQILCEAKILPGALLRNQSLKFVDTWVELESQTAHTRWSFEGTCKIPVAHGEGRYYIKDEDLKHLENSNQVWLRYKNNPNGSVSNIAGILNDKKNVGGLMPHPERAVKKWMGCDDGLKILETFLGGM